MPLVTSWAGREPATITDKSIEQRTYRVGSADDFIDYKEIVEREIRQWKGFTENAASAKIDENEQPTGGTNQTYSWSMNEDSRVVGSYTIERQFEKKTTSVIGTTPVPVIGSVNFSVASNNNVTFPLSVTLSTNVAGASIRYRIDSYNGGSRVTGTWETISGTSGSVNINTTNIAGGATIGGVRMHKYVIIEAYAFRVLQTGTYEGPKSEREYGVRAPVMGAVNFSPSSNTNLSEFPVSLNLSTSSPAEAKIWWGRRILQSNGQLYFTAEQQSENNSTVSVSVSDSGSTFNAAGAKYNNISYHRYVQVYAASRIIIDGYDYYGAFGEREYGQRPPSVFTPEFSPVGETTQYYWGTTLPSSITLRKPDFVSLSGEIDYTWYYVQSNGATAVGGSGTATTPTFNVSAYNNSYKVFNVLGYSEATFQTIIVVARGKVFLNGVTYTGANNTRYYTKWLTRKL